MITLLGRTKDPHIQLLREAFRRAALPHSVHDYVDDQVTVAVDGLPSFTRMLTPSDILFWRFKPLGPAYITNQDEGWYFFEDREWYHLLAACSDQARCKVINDPLLAERASLKPVQLNLARQLDLHCPDYILSNDRTALLRFAESIRDSGREVILKPMDQNVVPADDDIQKTHFILTSTVTADEILTAPDISLRRAPVFLQERIEKQYELRVICVGNETVAFKIDSQEREETRTDWRLGQMVGMFSPIDLDSRLSAQLSAFLGRLGMYHGIFDLAVDTAGRAVFFECNIEGQWAWLDRWAPHLIGDLYARQIGVLLESMHSQLMATSG